MSNLPCYTFSWSMKIWLWVRRLFKKDAISIGVDFVDGRECYIVSQKYNGIYYVIFTQEIRRI